jgi:hypothetical protein
VQLTILITSIILLGYLAFQDFKERAISWWLIPVLFVLLSVVGLLQNDWQTFITGVVINLGIIAVQLGVVTLYFSIKHKRFVNIIDTMLGWGDILFFVVLAATLSPINFVLGYTICLLVVLFGWLLYKSIVKPLQATIPLAGGMAIVLSFVLVLSMAYPQINLYKNILLW